MVGWLLSETVHSTLSKIVAVEVGHAVTLVFLQQAVKLFFSLLNVTLFPHTKRKPINILEDIPDDPPTRIPYHLLVPLVVGLIRMVGKLLNQTALLTVTMSFINTVSVTGPVFALVQSFVVLNERPALMEVCSLVPIILGLTLSTLNESAYTSTGLLCALGSTGLFNLSNIITKKALRDYNLNVNQLLVYTDTVTLAFLVPMWFYDGSQHWDSVSTSAIITKIVLTGFFSFLHSLFTMHLLASFTALSYAILNVFKRLVLIAGSAIYFGNNVTPLNQLGVFVASGGVLWYSKLKVKEHEKQ